MIYLNDLVSLFHNSKLPKYVVVIKKPQTFPLIIVFGSPVVFRAPSFHVSGVITLPSFFSPEISDTQKNKSKHIYPIFKKINESKKNIFHE